GECDHCQINDFYLQNVKGEGFGDGVVRFFLPSSMSSTTEQERYFAAFHVPNTFGKSLHLTLAYVGEQSPSQLAILKEDVAALVGAVAPLTITFGERVMFGKNEDIPVRLVQPIGQGSARALQLMEAFYAKHYKV